MNHPHATLPNILTFMWCIWKARNDQLFQRRSTEPYQISMHANALSQNLELCDATMQNLQGKEKEMAWQQPSTTLQGSTITMNEMTISNAIFCDASWKCRNSQHSDGEEATGIGVYIQADIGGDKCSLMIQASTSIASSAFQAEAMALRLAATLANLLNISMPIYLLDNQVLAKVAASRELNHTLLRWDSREILADFFESTSNTSCQVYHIKRNYNEIAHNCAAQATRQRLQQPTFRCTCSAHVADNCPIVSVLRTNQLQGYVLHDVTCN